MSEPMTETTEARLMTIDLQQFAKLSARLNAMRQWYHDRPAIDQGKQLPQLAEISVRECAEAGALLGEASIAIDALLSEVRRLEAEVEIYKATLATINMDAIRGDLTPKTAQAYVNAAVAELQAIPSPEQQHGK